MVCAAAESGFVFELSSPDWLLSNDAASVQGKVRNGECTSRPVCHCCLKASNHTKISTARADKQFLKGALVCCSEEISFESRPRASYRWRSLHRSIGVSRMQVREAIIALEVPGVRRACRVGHLGGRSTRVAVRDVRSAARARPDRDAAHAGGDRKQNRGARRDRTQGFGPRPALLCVARCGKT
ncbi:hypothetical protein AWB69_07239 [Caballeronia udeis]|uniref:Uncharacterized protein n=1 Tax=Caballeronia udeis TaxID=1232866 RepID=A0A158J7I0_9BURK|nr:hypothetical protein AWB69_07239 [Caballeronia udeis]